MKKTACFAVAMLLMLCASVPALGAGGGEMWEKKARLDEFNIPADDYYISNAEPITGTFDDKTTSNSMLESWMLIDIAGQSVSIRLVKNGTDIVKNPTLSVEAYDVTMLDSAGKRHYMTAGIPSGGDAVIFDEDDSALIIDALTEGGPVRFAITQSAVPTNKYVFSIEDTMEFADYMPYTDIKEFSEGLAAVKKGNKWGFIDTTGKTVIPYQWNYATSFYNKLASVFDGTVSSYGFPDTKTGAYGFIDMTGELAILCEFTDVYSFTEGLKPVKKDDKWGFIDDAGKTVIPFEWDKAVPFSNDLARVQKNGKWGYIDATGKLVIPCQWDYAYSFEDGIAIVFNGTLNSYGNPNNGKYGYIDTEGKPIVACELDDANFFYDGLAAVQKNGKWGFIDRSGKTVVPCTWDKVGDFSEGLAWVFAGTLNSYGNPDSGKFGYVDSAGNYVIPFLWDDASAFSQGLAAVCQNDLYGYIDVSGNLVIPCQWDWARSFNSGISRVVKDGLYGLIDTEGTLISPCQWDSAYSMSDEFTEVRIGDYFSGLCGALDISGNLIIPCEYDDIRYGEGYFTLLKNGELIICDSEGNRTN